MYDQALEKGGASLSDYKEVLTKNLNYMRKQVTDTNKSLPKQHKDMRDKALSENTKSMGVEGHHGTHAKLLKAHDEALRTAYNWSVPGLEQKMQKGNFEDAARLIQNKIKANQTEMEARDKKKPRTYEEIINIDPLAIALDKEIYDVLEEQNKYLQKEAGMVSMMQQHAEKIAGLDEKSRVNQKERDERRERLMKGIRGPASKEEHKSLTQDIEFLKGKLRTDREKVTSSSLPEKIENDRKKLLLENNELQRQAKENPKAGRLSALQAQRKVVIGAYDWSVPGLKEAMRQEDGVERADKLIGDKVKANQDAIKSLEKPGPDYAKNSKIGEILKAQNKYLAEKQSTLKEISTCTSTLGQLEKISEIDKQEKATGHQASFFGKLFAAPRLLKATLGSIQHHQHK